jgi:hypothetical protein
MGQRVDHGLTQGHRGNLLAAFRLEADDPDDGWRRT